MSGLMIGTYCTVCKQMTGLRGHAPDCRVPVIRDQENA